MPPSNYQLSHLQSDPHVHAILCFVKKDGLVRYSGGCLRRQRQEDLYEFKASQGCTIRPCLSKQANNNKNQKEKKKKKKKTGLSFTIHLWHWWWKTGQRLKQVRVPSLRGWDTGPGALLGLPEPSGKDHRSCCQFAIFCEWGLMPFFFL